MYYKVQVRKAKPGKPNPNFIPSPSVSKRTIEDRDLARQCAELISQLIYDYTENQTKAEQDREDERIAKKLMNLLLFGPETGKSELAESASVDETTHNEKKAVQESKHESTAKDDLIHFYQEALRELGCDVRVERIRIPEFIGTAFHVVPGVRHTITNKEGYCKEIAICDSHDDKEQREYGVYN